MKVVVLAPIDTSPFARVVCGRCLREPGVELAGIVVRRILNPERVRSELRRDGFRLLGKVWTKLVLGSDDPGTRDETGFFELAEREGLAGTPLSRLAREHGIPLVRVLDHNDAASLALLERVRPDVVAFTGGGILRKPVLEAAGHGVLNTHMGPLPEYRGMDVVEWPLLEGRAEEPGLGVALHFMAAGIDTGPILRFDRVPIRPGDGLERLRKRFEPVMADAMLEGIRAVRDDRLEPRPQAADEGRQYFVMHPRLVEAARRALAKLAAAESGEPE